MCWLYATRRFKVISRVETYPKKIKLGHAKLRGGEEEVGTGRVYNEFI